MPFSFNPLQVFNPLNYIPFGPNVPDFLSTLRDDALALYPKLYNLPTTQLDATVDPHMTKGNHTVLNGSGIPDSHWQIQKFHGTDGNPSGELEGVAGYRTGNFIPVDHVGSDGTMYVNGPAGHQVPDPEHGVTTTAANRGALTIGEGVYFSNQTLQQFFNSGGQVVILTDVDPSKNVSWDVQHAGIDASLNSDPSHVVLYNDKNQPVSTDSKGTANGFQQFDNLAFHSGLDTNPSQPGVQPGGDTPPGYYDRIVEIIGSNGVVLASEHYQYHLV